MARYNVGDAVLKIAPDLSGFQAKLEAELEAVKASCDVILKPDFEKFVSELNTGLEAIEKATRLKVKVEADTTEASAHVDAWRQSQEQSSVRQKVDADTTQASVQLASWRARQEATTVKQRVVIDRIDPPGGGGDGDGGGNFGDAERNMRVVQNFHGTTLFNLANIAAAATAIGGVVAALGGVVAAAAAAGTALGAMGAVIGVGSSGIIGAFTAMKKESAAAGTAGTDSAKEQREALDRVADAADAARRAQDDYGDALGDVKDANDDLKRAQDELSESWAKGSRELRDLNDQVVDAGQSQERAAINVARAKERALQVKADFRKGDASQLDVQDAELSVREAQSDFKQAQNRFADTNQDVRKANSRGVVGTNAVQSAQDNVLDAQKGVKDAQDRAAESAVRLARANRELAQAQADLAAGTGTSSKAHDKFAAAMAKLSPNAQDFVNKIRSLGDQWHSLRTAVQDRLFEGMGDAVVNVANKQLPELQRGMVQLAGVANGVLIGTMERVSRTFTEFSNNGTFDRFLNAVEASFSGFAPVIDSIVRALTELTITMGPSLGQMFQAMAKYIVDTTPFWSNLGKVAIDAITQIFPILTQLFTAFEPGAVLIPLMVSLLQQFADIVTQNQGPLKELAIAIGDAMKNMMAGGSEALPTIIFLLRGLAEVIAWLDPSVIAAIFTAMLISRTVLNPMLSLANNFGRMQALMGNLRTAAVGFGGALSRVGSAMSTTATGASSMGSAIASRATSAWETMRIAGMLAMDKLKAGAQATASAASTAFSAAGRGISTGLSAAASGGRAALDAAGRGASAAWGFLTGLPGRIAASTAAQRTASAATAAWAGVVRGASLAWAFVTGLPARIAATTVAQRAAAAATTAWSVVQGVLNAVMTANPIGLLVVAIGAVIAAIVIAYNRSDEFREICQKTWEVIKGAAMGAWNGILKPLFETFVENLKNIGKVFEGLGQIFKAGWDFIGNVIKTATGLITGDFDLFNDGLKGMGKVAGQIAEGIKTAFSGIVGVIKAPVHAIGRLLEKIPNKVLGISIPGADTLRSWGKTLTNLRDGGKVNSGRRANGMLYGPGTETSDSILGYDESGPTAWVSRDESVVNARGTAKHFDLVQRINADDPSLADLPRRAEGGPVYGPFLPGRKPKPEYYPQNTAPENNPAPPRGEYYPQNTAPENNPDPNFYKEWYGNGGDAAPADAGVTEFAPTEDGAVAPVTDPTQLAAPAAPGAPSTPSAFTGTGAIYGGDAAQRARAYAESHAGEPYEYGVLDCSGFMSGIYNAFTGKNIRFTTEDDFLSLGFVEGLTDGFQIGVHRGGGGPNSHMAGTLPDGTPVESDGGNGIQVGGSADGADDGQFELKYTLPPDMWSPPGVAGDSGTDLGYGDSGSDSGSGSEIDGMSFEDWLADGGDTTKSRTLKDGQVEVEETDAGSDSDMDKLNVPSMFGKAGEIIGMGFLSFFGLENSILSGDNVYNKAIQDTVDFYGEKDKKDKKKKKSQYKSKTGNVGNGDPDSAKSADLLNGADTPEDFLYDTESPVLDARVPDQTYNPEGGVDQWTENIRAALIREGFEPSEQNINLTKAQMQTESGGDPEAVQQVIDVNSGGNEAVGAMQITPGTFAANRNPELPDDRTNIDASLSAALRYYRGRYGDDLSTHWGKGHGYDSGGWLEPTPNGFGTYFNHTGDPEAVLTSGQWGSVDRLIDTVGRAVGFGGVGVGEMSRMAGMASPSSTAMYERTTPSAGLARGRSVTHDRSVHMGTVYTQNPDELRQLLERQAAQDSQAHLPAGF